VSPLQFSVLPKRIAPTAKLAFANEQRLWLRGNVRELFFSHVASWAVPSEDAIAS
jgi:hypothetical protein